MHVSIKWKLNALLLAIVMAMSAASLTVYHLGTRSIESYERILDNLLLVSRIPGLVLEVNHELAAYQRSPSPQLRATIEGRVRELARLSREVKDKTPEQHTDSTSTIQGVHGMVGSLGEHVAFALDQIDRQERTARLVESVEIVDKIVGFSRVNVDAYVSQELRNMVPMREQTLRDNRYLSLALQLFILTTGLGALVLGVLFTNRVIARPLDEVIVASRKLAEGRFEGTVSQRRGDEIGALAVAFQEMQGVLDRLLRETTRLFDAFRGGKMDVRGEAGAFSGSFGQLVSGINNVIDAVAARGEEVRHAKQAPSSVNQQLSAANDLLLQEMEERQQAQRERDAMQAELLDTARKAGMAEIATSVLHNIGNALTSVNISAEVTRKLVRASRIRDVSRIADLLDQHSHDLGTFLTEDERGKVLPAFLRKLSSVLAEEQGRMLSELDELRRMVDHAKDILAWQQSYAGVAGVTEELSPIVLLEDALRIAKVGRERDTVTIEKDFAEVPSLRVERHKVVQILVNLLTNALHAIKSAGSERGVITLKLHAEEPGTISIEVRDNGIGIPPENLGRMFQYGFTTREGGHGFGLHSCAITATELGGEIKAESEGYGKGARFTLRLPLEASGG
jgi:C4-dicarboxylate-specific signal transduction histidine kinase